jgi:hypothetical protein
MVGRRQELLSASGPGSSLANEALEPGPLHFTGTNGNHFALAAFLRALFRICRIKPGQAFLKCFGACAIVASA